MSLLLFYRDLVSTLKGTSEKYQNFTDSIIVCTFGSFVNTRTDVSTLILEDVCVCGGGGFVNPSANTLWLDSFYASLCATI